MRQARLGKKISIGNHTCHTTLEHVSFVENLLLLKHYAICVGKPDLLTLHPCSLVPCTHVESSSQEGGPHEQCMHKEIQAQNECVHLDTMSAAAEAQ